MLHSKTAGRVLLAVCLGVLGAVAAQAFIALLDTTTDLLLVGLGGYQPPTPRFEGNLPPALRGTYGLLLVPVATTLGGLGCGLLLRWLLPDARGHGTDAAVAAWHANAGDVQPRAPFVRAVAAALTIGSGGAGGREGTTTQLAAGIAALVTRGLGLPAAERRLFVLAGVAAGLSAAFKSPLGAALFAVEVLYSSFDFEAAALVYCVISATVAYALTGVLHGWTPLLHVPSGLVLHHPGELLWFLALAVLAALTGIALTTVFHATSTVANRMALPRWLKPALGGLGVGLLGLAVPEVLGSGYGWMQRAIDGQVGLDRAAIMVPAKIAALALTIGSGGLGGVFAPCLYVGCMLGVVVGGAAAALGMAAPPTAALVVVGLAAVFGAAGRVPLASVLMTAEITGGYGLLVPAMLAVAVAYLLHASIGRRLNLAAPLLFGSQVPTRADSPTHATEAVDRTVQLLRTGQLTVEQRAELSRALGPD